MGKQNEKKRKQVGGKSGDSSIKQAIVRENSMKACNAENAIFIALSQELKDEGNRLFQIRDYEGAMLKYEKAIKFLPRNHIDVSYLRSNLAACYMQMGLTEYPRAIHECNLALEVTPKYSKALLKRARCYETLNKMEFALRDVNAVLKMEPNNIMAAEIAARVKSSIEKKGINVNDIPVDLIPVPDYVESSYVARSAMIWKERVQKKKSGKSEKKIQDASKAVARREESEAGDEREENNAGDERGESKVVDERKESKDGNERQENNAGDKREEKKAEQERVETKAYVKREESKAGNQNEEKRTEDKLVMDEKNSNITEEVTKRMIKLVFGEDIRWAQIPVNCCILKMREVIRDRFKNSKAFLIKYRDDEGDLITITTNEELRWAEASAEKHPSFRLSVVEVDPEQDPFFEKDRRDEEVHKVDVKSNGFTRNGNVKKGKSSEKRTTCIEDWIIQFAQLFKNYVGFDSDAYFDIHELGLKLCSEAMEEAVTSEEAQDIFNTAGDKFQEMAALALFNWGNVHMSRARKRLSFTDDVSKESVILNVESAYRWAHKEYSEAGKKYQEALKIKSDFYEGIVALGQQQFEQAKLSWYYALCTNVNLEAWPSEGVVQLYDDAEDNMEKGMLMLEKAEEELLNEESKLNKEKALLHKMELVGLINDVPSSEAEEHVIQMRTQINILWGTMLYERSIMEYKLEVPIWHECLEVAVEKFELAGASPTDIAVMIKNHCSNDNNVDGLGFNIDEIVQAWNEMYEAKRWLDGVSTFRLEPLLRRRVSKLYHLLENK